MPRINILSPFVADLIAAGEVVERPASAVKELLENAVDAGAKNVTVEIRGGGAEYIKVTDDGCGMSPEDAGIAFLRHATKMCIRDSITSASRRRSRSYIIRSCAACLSMIISASPCCTRT